MVDGCGMQAHALLIQQQRFAERTHRDPTTHHCTAIIEDTKHVRDAQQAGAIKAGGRRQAAKKSKFLPWYSISHCAI
jgi:hypothetical protein